MSGARIPESEWVNFDNDIEGFAGSAREVLSRLSMSPSHHTQGTIPNDGGWSWWGGPSDPDFQPPNPLGMYPRMPPPTPRLPPVPLPPVTHGHNGYDNPLGGGDNIHQPAREWADGSPRDGETSMSLAVTKPNNTENGNQSETSAPDARITRRLAQICEALGIPSMGAELLILQRIIVLLRGTVPNWTIGTYRNRRREARRACYEELWRLVGSPTERPSRLRVLDNVLAKVTSQDNGALDREVGHQPYRVVRLGNW